MPLKIIFFVNLFGIANTISLLFTLEIYFKAWKIIENSGFKTKNCTEKYLCRCVKSLESAEFFFFF